MSTIVTYKGSTLTTATNQTKTLKTAGKYMEDDVTIVDSSGYVTQDQDGFIILPPDGGGSPSVSGSEYETGTLSPSEYDTLEIFGDEFTGVTGIKATNDNDETVIFYHAVNGSNLEYGLTDGTLPLVGVGKVGLMIL